MNKKKLQKISKELKKASAMHKGQAKRIDGMLNAMQKPKLYYSKPKQTKKKKGTAKLLSKSKPSPTRQDSIASAYHHNHMFHKNKNYMNDPYYDASKKRAKKVAKKFPELDKYMRVRKNRAKIGYDYK
tara:strand:- start:1304 stop:1687 length:384 start_codon:yes stop_codon:yes gene_type:complete